MSRFERDSIVSGIGLSSVGRRLGRTGLDLTVESARRAIADAGLRPEDIDGLSTWPGSLGVGGVTNGFSGPTTWEVHDALRLSVGWHTGSGIEGPSQLAAFISACLAISAGLAKHVLVYRTVTEATEQGAAGRTALGVGAEAVGGWAQWSVPFGAYSGANRTALHAARHFFEYGTTREQLGAIPVVCRANASRNPDAVYRDPLSIDDYLAARMISTPLCLYDCDVPVDGSVSIVVSHAAHAADMPKPAVGVEAVGTALRGRPSWEQWESLTDVAAFHAARSMWERTSLRPADVDVAQLYDGFSFGALVWLEALGFCDPGEGGAFVEGGERISLDGSLPLNTSGGQLSGGRLSGFGLLHEAIVQLRGDGGGRQVPGSVDVAVVSNGLGPIAGSVLLTSS